MAGTPKPIGRILIIPRGDYSATTQYDSLDLVRYDSKSWLCKTDGITCITPTEGTDWTCIAKDGTDGTDGADGRGIVNIQRTGTDPSNPLVDIYTITYTDGTTSTYTVTNGSGGTTVDTMLKSVYDTDDDGIVDEAKHAINATNATTANDATNAKNLKKSDGTIVDADAITTKLSKLDSWHQYNGAIEEHIINNTNVDDTVTFHNIDTSKAYELWFDTSDGQQATVKSSLISGTDITYTVNTPTVGTKFRLLVKGI